MRLRNLIERGTEKAGSARAFAAQLGIAETHLSNYKSGSRACGIEMHAKIASAAGLTDTQVRDYVWGVLKERMGKLTEKAAVAALLFIGFTSTGFVQPAAAAGPDFGPKSDNV